LGYLDLALTGIGLGLTLAAEAELGLHVGRIIALLRRESRAVLAPMPIVAAIHSTMDYNLAPVIA
jgi:hypothetical protein